MLSSILSTRLSRLNRKETGFTLIELLVVVIIIGVLAAIALPIFINQQRVAVDASVKSDVRNTVTNLNNWLVSHRGVAVANTAAYTNSTNQGTVAQSRPGTTVGVQVQADGRYTVCAFNDGGNDYRSAENAWTFNASSGQFFQQSGTGASCPGAVDASGNDLSTTPVAAKLTGSTTLADATQETDYSANLTATGNPAATFSIPTTGANSLPAGLTYDSTSGKISGQPTASVTAGTYTIAVTAKNFAGSDTQNYTLKVLSKDATPTFAAGATYTFPTLTRGTAASRYTVTTSGYPTPAISVASGSVPSGMSLVINNDGTATISGTPNSGAVGGSLNLTATNRKGSAAETINCPVQYPATLTTSALDSGYQGALYNFKVVAAGNPTPTVTVDKTTLPAGLTANSNSDGTATISGTPTGTVTNQQVKITVSNGVGSAAVTTLPLTIASSTIYSEDFESTSTYTLPTGWSASTCTGSHYVQYAGYSRLFFTGNGTKNLAIDSCYGYTDVNAVSPSITLTPGTYVVSAQMAGDTSNNNLGQKLEILSGSTVLSTKTINTGSSFGTNSQTLTVSATTTVKLNFHGLYQGYSDGTPGLFIDNVLVKRS